MKKLLLMLVCAVGLSAGTGTLVDTKYGTKNIKVYKIYCTDCSNYMLLVNGQKGTYSGLSKMSESAYVKRSKDGIILIDVMNMLSDTTTWFTWDLK